MENRSLSPSFPCSLHTGPSELIFQYLRKKFEKTESKMDLSHAELIKPPIAQPNYLGRAAETVDGVPRIFSLT